MKPYFIFSFLVILVVLSGCSQGSSKYDTFAKCLTEKRVTMYGTEWCSHCQNQKKAFGDSFQFINFVDCDRNKDICLEKGIRGYPTWIIDGKAYPGEQRLERLASLSGCELIEDE
ncbi:hypothetical protein CL621_03675 [archaeon]|nr:hypothetical protein [archaeon]|tara:strand:- start:666 stop:1010 length:345 start_codon:yes stop_codon:yes gene_type:complete